MRIHSIIVVMIVACILGTGRYVTVAEAQNGTLPTFRSGDVLDAEALNAVVQQVEANTNALNNAGSSLQFSSTLSRAQEVPTPAGGTVSSGRLEPEFDAGLTQATVRMFTVEGESTNVTAAHLHCNLPGATGDVVFGFMNPGDCTFEATTGTFTCPPLTNDDFTGADCTPLIGRPVNNIAALFFAAREGFIYVNVHTSDNSPGEIRGQLLQD